MMERLKLGLAWTTAHRFSDRLPGGIPLAQSEQGSRVQVMSFRVFRIDLQRQLEATLSHGPLLSLEGQHTEIIPRVGPKRCSRRDHD